MRINFFGGPGAGKSITAARLFSNLKMELKSVELVTEYIKAWAYQKRLVNPFDQVYIFGKQHQYEYRYLTMGVKNIITDSPVLLSAVYAPKELTVPITMLSMAYDKEFPSLNIFLQRNDKPYVQDGRWQSKEEAQALDQRMHDLVQGYCTKMNLPLFFVDFQDYRQIDRLAHQYLD